MLGESYGGSSNSFCRLLRVQPEESMAATQLALVCCCACLFITGFARAGPCELPCSGPNYFAIVCEISSELDSTELVEQALYFQYDVAGAQRPCTVAEGMQLEVRCENEYHVLYKNGSRSSFGDAYALKVAFAVQEEVGGTYECRLGNGSVSSSRLVEVDGEKLCHHNGSSSLPSFMHSLLSLSLSSL